MANGQCHRKLSQLPDWSIHEEVLVDSPGELFLPSPADVLSGTLAFSTFTMEMSGSGRFTTVSVVSDGIRLASALDTAVACAAEKDIESRWHSRQALPTEGKAGIKRNA